MDNMSKQANGYYRPVAQSYTYSHYYKNTKPYYNYKSKDYANPNNSANYYKNPRNSNYSNNYSNIGNSNNYSNNYSNTRNSNNYSTNYSNIGNSNNYSNNYSNTRSPNNYSDICCSNNYFQRNNFEKINRNQENTFNDDSLLYTDVYGKASSYSSEECNNQNSNCNQNCNSNQNFGNTSNQNSNSTLDFTSIFNSFFQNNFSDKQEEKSNNTTSEKNNPFDFLGESFNMPDFETILKLKKIFEKINSSSSKNTPIINLLNAIKPFTQDSKKSIIDQLSKFITLSSVLQELSDVI